MAVLPGRDGIERLCWQPFLNGPDSVTAALDIRLRGAHGVTLRDVLLLELLTRPDRKAHHICALAQTLGVSPSRLATQVRRLEGRGLVTRRPSRRDPRGILPRITGEGNTGARINDDPAGPGVISEAAAEIAASRDQLLDAISRLFDVAQAGEVISCDERSLLPRNQLRCAQRAVAAVDAIFAGSGGNAACKSNPLQRFWRDAHVGLGHAVHLSDMIYQSSALTAMGGQAP